MTDRPFTLRCGEALQARLVAIVRNHHDSMPGGGRDRPGVDRLRVEVPGGGEQLVDVWSNGRQDVAAAEGPMEIFESDGLLCWRSTALASAGVPPANDSTAPPEPETPSDAVGPRRAKAAQG